MSDDVPIRCVCFDWGGVILRICRGFVEGVRAAGLELRPGADAPDAIAARRVLAQAYSKGEVGRAEFLCSASRATGGAYSPEEIERINHAWLIEEYPGIGAVIDQLLALPRIETALLSNTTEIHWERQHREPSTSLGIPHFPTAARLRHRHASHLFGLLKPDPAIYGAFERATGFSGGSILFFDDLEENVLAARACGWRAERIDHTGDTAHQVMIALKRHRVL